VTTTTQNISTARTVEWTVEDICSLAWQTARMVNIRQTPDEAEIEWARKWIMLKMDSLQARARIARSVIFEDVELEAGTADYTLSADIFDVVGDAMLVDDADVETPVLMRGRDFYQSISDKTVEGTPTTYYASKLNVITLKLWPVPSSAWTLRIQAVKWLRSATSSEKTNDLDRYFNEYLVTALAYEIARANSIDLAYCLTLRKDSEDLLKMALGAAKQRGPVQMKVVHRTGWIR
jgi:hypothetical protein